MKLLLILFSLSISAQGSLDKSKILLDKLILETKKSLYNTTFEIAKKECPSSKGVPLKKCYQDTLDFSRQILSQYRKEAAVVIQDASRNTHKYFSLQKDGTWGLDGQKIKVKDGAEMNIKILKSELQKKWQESIQKVGHPKGQNLQKRRFRLFRGGSKVADDAVRQGTRHADDIAGSHRPIYPNGSPPAAGPFNQAPHTPGGKPNIPPHGKIDEAAQLAEQNKGWLKLSFEKLFESTIAKVLGVVFAGVGLYSVMKFFFGEGQELPTFDEGSATFPDPFANDGSTVTFDDSQMDPFQQGNGGYQSGYPYYGGNQPGYPNYGGNQPGYPNYGGNQPGYPNYSGYQSGYPNYSGYQSGYSNYGGYQRYQSGHSNDRGYETGYGYDNYGAQDHAFQQDFATTKDKNSVQKYDDILDPATGYYWMFDSQANAYYRLDGVTSKRIYFEQ